MLICPFTVPSILFYAYIIQLLTRQSVHVDSLSRQADAHVPAKSKRRKKLSCGGFYTVYNMEPP